MLRILTGDRPTGALHLGHYVGSLAHRVELQRRGELFVLIADLHVLTTRPSREEVAALPGRVRELMLDYLAVGLAPERVVFYLQSGVPELAELYTLLQPLVTLARLQRLPSLKEMAAAAGTELTFALLGYPVLQAADILGLRAQLVPVGRDNLAHVEVTREIARRFNHRYGAVFPVPRALVGQVPELAGTDGVHKMSKSRGNAILLRDDPETVARKVRSMYTDPTRVRADVPGRVESNPVFQYLDAFDGDRAAVEQLKQRYRLGRVGDVEVKERLARVISSLLAPWQERRARLARDAGLLDELVARGTKRARVLAAETLRAAQGAMGFTRAWSALGLARESHGRTVPTRRGRGRAERIAAGPAKEGL